MAKYLKIYKIGNFYNAYGDDGIIIHYLIKYKYVEYKKSVGFPKSSYNKVINILQCHDISYEIYDKDTLQEQYNGISKRYDKILKEALNAYNMEQRVARLRKKINDCTFEELESLIMGTDYGK